MRNKIRGMIAAAILCAGLGAVQMTAAAEETIGQGVFIHDIDVSGMTYAEADAAVKQEVSQTRSDVITLQVGEDSVEVTASELGISWKNPRVVKEAINLGNSGNIIKRYKETKELGKEKKVLDLHFAVNETAVRSIIDERCMQFEKEPQEASISSDGGGGFNLQPSVTGQEINVDESVKAIVEYMDNEWQGGAGQVALKVDLTEPKGDQKDLETIQDCLGTFTTWYGSTAGRNKNVERGAELLNGHVIWPGESFSVCDHLVPFNAENGYELGGAYENGRVVQEYGGGICQVSTTLYNALLLAELEIVERSNHTMTVNYVEPSMDAAIAEGYMDLVFRNNQETPIFISGYGYGGELTFSIWGKETRPADRSVYYRSVVLSENSSAGTQLIARPDLPVGSFTQVQSAMAGLSAELWKDVTYNGETTSEHINSSTYQATPNSYEVGTMGASDALMQAIYANDLAAAQAAAAGGAQTEPQTEQPSSDGVTIDPGTGDGTVTTPDTGTGNGTVTTPDTGTGDGTVTTPDTGTGDGYWTDTPDGEVFVPGNGGDSGVVTW